MLHGHGGNRIELAKQLGCSPGKIIDMSSNINPLNSPPGLIKYLKENIAAAGEFPEVDSAGVSDDFASHYDLAPERVLAGNGSTQLIYMIPQALALKSVLIAGPTYSDYADACHLHHVTTTFVLAEAAQNFQIDIHKVRIQLENVDAVFICNPNNPTGSLISPDVLSSLCRAFPETVFIIDESYLPFVHDGEALSLGQLDYPNLIVLSSISKIFAIPGLRIGFMISSAAIIEKFKRFSQPWSVNRLAQLAAGYLMVNKAESQAFIEQTRRYIEAEKQHFLEATGQISGLQLFPSSTNFMLAGLPEGLAAGEVLNRLAQDKFLIRNCRNFKGLSERFIRISLKTPEANQRLAEKLHNITMAAASGSQPPQRKICAGC
jgi:threonine-phosphate decarboxylase